MEQENENWDIQSCAQIKPEVQRHLLKIKGTTE